MTLTELKKLAKKRGVKEIVIKAMDSDNVAWTNAYIEDEEIQNDGELTIYILGE